VRLVVEAPQPAPQLLAHPRVEGAERLVQKQNLRIDGERAREAHPLALSARELRRVALGQPLELDELQQLCDAVANVGARTLPHPEAEGDVLVHGHVLERGVVLEDEADAALLGRPSGDVLVGDQHLAGIGALESGDHPQERRLAAAARTEERGQRSLRHVQRDPVEGDKVAELLLDVSDNDGHQVPSFGLNRFMASRVRIASAASTTEAAYAPEMSNPSNCSWT
jgi:hypothetical protein